jgi:hypothetical protein
MLVVLGNLLDARTLTNDAMDLFVAEQRLGRIPEQPYET